MLIFQQAPLHAAVREGQMRQVKYLVEQGTDINIKDDHGVSVTTVLLL